MTETTDRASDWLGNARELGGDLWTGGRGPILVTVAAGWFLSLGVRMIYPAILPQLRAAYGLDLTTAGLLITVLWIAYALGQLPGGVLDDRLGGGLVLAASTAISAVALAAVVTAGTVSVLFGATVLFGFATALYGVARFTILSTIYPDHDGTAIGLTMAAGDLGNALLPPLGGFLAVVVAWQVGLGFAVPLFFVSAVSLWLVVSDGDGPVDGDETHADQPDGFLATLDAVVSALRQPAIVVVMGIQILTYFIWQGFTGLYPTYLIEAKGIAPTTATVMFGGFFALGIVVKPIAGTVYDGYGIHRSLPFMLGIIVVGMLLLAISQTLPLILLATALASGVLGYGTITLTFLTDSLPESVQGTGLGSLRTTYMLVGATSPTVIGALGDAGYFDEAFLVLGLIAAVSLALCLAIPRGLDPKTAH